MAEGEIKYLMGDINHLKGEVRLLEGDIKHQACVCNARERQVYTERKGHGQVDILWMLKQYDGWIKGAGQKNLCFKRFNLKHTNTNQKCTVCLTMPLPDDYFL